MKILLADDSVTAQNMGKKILSEAGHEVVCVSNGAAALKKVSEQEPDLVILDIYMPGYSGLEVCQKLKEASGTADVPVVLTVGKLEPFRKEDAQRVRAEALIVKPFEASELAAAVGRFAEIISARPAKSKPGKLGPQPKAKPKWDEPSPDEFVTTTQQLEEQEAPAAEKSSAEAGAEKAKAGMDARSPETGSEFEVRPEAETAEAVPAAQNEVEPSPDFGNHPSPAEMGSQSPEATPAEFNVQADDVRPQGEQPQVMAAAAGAGGEFGNIENQPEMGVTASSAPDFAVMAHVESPAVEPPAFEPPVTAEGAGLASPDLATGAAPELSAAGAAPEFSAEPAGAPSVDPAFDPDRTQWVTQFATHFGIREETAEQSAATPSEPAATEAGSSSPEEIAAILSNLPGGGFATSPEPPAAEDEQKRPDVRAWPVEASGSETSGWKAEEVPLQDQESSVSLAEEMNKAAGEPEPEVPAAPVMEETASLPSAPSAVETGAAEAGQAAEPTHAASPLAEEDGGAGGMGSLQPEGRVEEPVAENSAGAAEPDRVSGVMHSAAMAIATRATVSAVASHLHSQPQSQGAAMGPTAIEELVGQVLERLKPKLIAEIKRELKTEEK